MIIEALCEDAAGITRMLSDEHTIEDAQSYPYEVGLDVDGCNRTLFHEDYKGHVLTLLMTAQIKQIIP